ncbi:MAG: TolC family protein [Planctomycetes bacterium]|nr:TolC family protein [Planctomycetota bacterium]
MRSTRGFSVAVLLAAWGCTTYEKKPLRPDDLLEQVRRTRALAAEGPAAGEAAPATFGKAAELLREHSPALARARAAYRVALDLADVSTPLPNPGIEVGPEFGFGPAVVAHRVEPVGSLSFAIPLSARLARQDDLNRLEAAAAQVELLVRHREEYLRLRRAWAAAVLARRERAVAAELIALSKRSAEFGRKLVEVGEATALDLGLLELDLARAETGELDARIGDVEASADLASISGVAPEAFSALPAESLPALDVPVPAMEEVTGLLVANHPELARLRAAYDVAEGALRLEISKQIPDFRFGVTGGGETGDLKYVLGLTLGIDIPIFDRNQQEVARALARREEVRTQYESALADALAALERARARLVLLLEKASAVRNRVLGRAKSQLDLALKGLEAGGVEALQVLETERSYRNASIEALAVEKAARAAWIDLEEAVGRPLLFFPDEMPERRPPEPYTEPKESGRLDGGADSVTREA